MKPAAQSRSRGNRRAVSARATETSAPRPQSTNKLHIALACAVLAVLAFAAYGNSLSNGFVWDDHQQILSNPSMKSGAPLAPLFTADARFTSHSQSFQNTDYRPLQMLTYRLLFSSLGADAGAFHLCSVLFAIACAIAAFFMFLQLTRRLPLALAAAALFVLHPVHTEAVDWIAALPELGFSLFLLVSFALFLKGRVSSQTRSTNYWLALTFSCLSYVLALLWKETAVVFPVLIAGYVWLMERDGEQQNYSHRLRSMLLASAPYVGVLLGYLGLRTYLLGTAGASSRNWALTPVQLAINAISLMEQYWAKLAFPLQLNAYYSFSPIRSLASGRATTVVLIALAAIAIVIVLLRRRSLTRSMALADASQNNFRLTVFAAFWTLITLLPVMNLGALGRNPFTERYLFLPSAGFCLLVALVASWAIEKTPLRIRRFLGPGLLTAALVCFLIETVERNPEWKDDLTIFSAALPLSPDAPFVHNMIATQESNDSTPSSDAEQHFLRAAALAEEQTPPDRLDAVTAYRGLAWIDANRSQYPQAFSLLTKASDIDPEDADTDGEKGLILARSGNGLAAMPLLERSLAAEPDNENVLSALGMVTRDDLHDPAKAAGLFERAIVVHGTSDDFAASQHNNLAAAYADLNNIPAAIEQLRDAVRILPADPEFHINLANALAQQGQLAEAQSEAEAAVGLAPQDQAARELLNQIQQAKATASR
jgi:tetratricopeptide (TPR) repeat protein